MKHLLRPDGSLACGTDSANPYLWLNERTTTALLDEVTCGQCKRTVYFHHLRGAA
jgi:hypothetical protein